jgi:serine/threonine-protein phosphatase 5
VVLTCWPCSRAQVKLDDLRKIDRFSEPPDAGLMSEMLWSDPQKMNGRGPSKRGVGVAFGPDVAARFLDDNGLDMLVVSYSARWYN